MEIEKNKLSHIWLVAYNNLDCNITNLVINIGSKKWGSSTFITPDDCHILTEGIGSQPKCDDISIKITPNQNIGSKMKQEFLVKIEPTEKAVPTIYVYLTSVEGSCTYEGKTYSLNEKEQLIFEVR